MANQLPTVQREMISSSKLVLVDQIHAMRFKELTMYKTKDYLRETDIAISHYERKLILMWAVEVAYQFGLDSQVVAIVAMNFLDRYLSNVDRKAVKVALSSKFNFQLCAVACLMIAVKNNIGLAIELDFFVDAVCHGLYDKSTLVEMELEVLDCLQWRISGPNVVDFMYLFLEMMPLKNSAIEMVSNVALVQIEKAMMDYSLVIEEPSSIAYAAVLLALECSHYLRIDAEPEWMHAVAKVGQLENKNKIHHIKSAIIEQSSLLNIPMER
jgi:hypothetical protein